jgi:hypothetical protein
VLAAVTARKIGRVKIAEALELTALVARKQPDRYGRFAAHWLCLYFEEHEKATLEDVTLLVSNLGSLATQTDHARGVAILRKAASPAAPRDHVATQEGNERIEQLLTERVLGSVSGFAARSPAPGPHRERIRRAERLW